MQQRFLTVSYIDQNGTLRPYIRLQGKWVEDQGFKIGDQIKVSTPAIGRIIIEKQERKDS